MRRGILFMGLFLAVAVSGCGDRLAELQGKVSGTWVLQSRELPDGTTLKTPDVSGILTWRPVDSRKAAVSLHIDVAAREDVGRTFNFSTSKYEISTSAITRTRFLLIRQGYRSSAPTPMSFDPKARASKGKITIEDGVVKIAHERGYNERFEGDRMIASFPGMFIDTWVRVR